MKTTIKLNVLRSIIKEVLLEELSASKNCPNCGNPLDECGQCKECFLQEKHMGFKKLVKALHAKGIKEDAYDSRTDEEITEDAAALAAWIGRKKMGKKAFQAKATAGKRKE